MATKKTPPKPKTPAPKPKRTAKPKVVHEIPEQSSIVDRSERQSQMALRLKVKMFYDLQMMRLGAESRVGPKAEGAEMQIHDVDRLILELRTRELGKAEKNALSDVEGHLESIGVYNEIFNDKVRYRGIGPTLWGVILSEFDPGRDTVSKWWSFAGLVAVPAQRCKGCHRIVEAMDGGFFVHKTAQRRFVKKGEEDQKRGSTVKCPRTEGTSLKTLSVRDVYESGQSARPVRGEKNKYNAWLRTKLCGVLAPCLLKLGSPWKKFYDDYKHRLQTRPGGWGTGDAHRHAAAMRYMVKMLLIDIHGSWRRHLGLPVRPPYAEEYHGKKHSGPAQAKPNGHHEPDGTGDTLLDKQIAAELALLE